MSEVAESPRTSAPVHGPRWSARAADWAELSAPISAPAWEAVAEATGIAKGTRVLDVACGSGEFCWLAAARGARERDRRRRVDDRDRPPARPRRRPPRRPDGEPPLGRRHPRRSHRLQRLPVRRRHARRARRSEASRPPRRAGRDLQLGPPGGKRAGRGHGRAARSPAASSTRSAAARSAGNRRTGRARGLGARSRPRAPRASEVNVPFEARDEETLLRALLAPGGVSLAIEHSGEGAVRKAISDASAPFRRPNGSYRIENTFRYLIARA
jgi:hypothetical protein